MVSIVEFPIGFIIVHTKSVLLNKSFSLSQKIRWLALCAKSTQLKRFIISNDKRVSLPKLVNAILRNTSTDSPIILDIGANVGLYTKAFAAAEKKPKKILAIEPSIYVFSILNIVTTQIPIVSTLRLALNDKEGVVQLKTPLKASGSLRVGLSHIGIRNDNSQHVEYVKARRLDKLLAEEQIEEVDVVKMDVEGAEEQVLKGAQTLLKKTKPIWFVELIQDRASNFDSSAHRIFRSFQHSGYKAFILNESYDWIEVQEISSEYDYLFIPV